MKKRHFVPYIILGMAGWPLYIAWLFVPVCWWLSDKIRNDLETDYQLPLVQHYQYFEVNDESHIEFVSKLSHILGYVFFLITFLGELLSLLSDFWVQIFFMVMLCSFLAAYSWKQLAQIMVQ